MPAAPSSCERGIGSTQGGDSALGAGRHAMERPSCAQFSEKGPDVSAAAHAPAKENYDI